MKKIKNNYLLTRISYKVEGEMKYKKNELNNLAIKVKLKNLANKKARFEIIYKSLLRDIRKFYIHDFVEKMDI